MRKEKKIKIIFLVIVLLVAILVVTGIVFESKKSQISTSSIKAKTSTSNAENNEEIQAIMQKDASGDNVPVPEGYVGSNATGENEIDTGYVIYEGTEPVTDSNVETAKTTRNQYVWVPVPDASKMYGIDENEKMCGKLYNFATSSSDSNYDELTGSYREPYVVTKNGSVEYDMDSILKTLELGAETTQEFLMQLEKEFNNMIKNIEKYRGFYIGRYETGDLNKEKAVVVKGNSNIASQTWYTMYKKCKDLKGSNNKVETGMIWGSQWDRTLMWLVESGNKTREEICNSTNWGNYDDNSEPGAGSRRPTGYSESWKANNIYDLAGNVTDWTMEANYNYYRVLRGGYYERSGSNYPVSDRDDFVPKLSHIYVGCRSVLYIK